MKDLLKNVKVEELNGLFYATVYSVHLVDAKGCDILYMTYFSKKLALEDVSFMQRNHGDKYLRIYCESNIVWF